MLLLKETVPRKGENRGYIGKRYIDFKERHGTNTAFAESIPWRNKIES